MAITVVGSTEIAHTTSTGTGNPLTIDPSSITVNADDLVLIHYMSERRSGNNPTGFASEVRYTDGTSETPTNICSDTGGSNRVAVRLDAFVMPSGKTLNEIDVTCSQRKAGGIVVLRGADVSGFPSVDWVTNQSSTSFLSTLDNDRVVDIPVVSPRTSLLTSDFPWTWNSTNFGTSGAVYMSCAYRPAITLTPQFPDADSADWVNKQHSGSGFSSAWAVRPNSTPGTTYQQRWNRSGTGDQFFAVIAIGIPEGATTTIVNLTASLAADSAITTATLTVTGDQVTVTSSPVGTSSVSATLTVTGDQVALTGSLTGTSAISTATLTVTAPATPVTAALVGTSSISTATLTVTGDQVAVTSSPVGTSSVSATLTVTGDQVTVSAAPVGTSSVSAALTVTGDQETITGSLVGTSAISTASLTVTGDQVALTAALTGTSSIPTATLTVTGDEQTVTAALVGTSSVAATLTVAGDQETISAALVGTSSVTAALTVTGQEEVSASLTGTSAISTATLTVAGADVAVTAGLTGASSVATTLTVVGDQVAVTGSLTGTSNTATTLTVTGDQEALTGSLTGTSAITTANLTVSAVVVNVTASLTGTSSVDATVVTEKTIDDVYELAVKIDRLVQVILALGLGGRRR